MSSKSDFFGTFLDSVSPGDTAPASYRGFANGAAAAARPSGGSSATLEQSVLRRLFVAEQPVSVKQLLDALGAAPSELIGTLQALSGANLINLVRDDGDERASLTDLGKAVAR